MIYQFKECGLITTMTDTIVENKKKPLTEQQLKNRYVSYKKYINSKPEIKAKYLAKQRNNYQRRKMEKLERLQNITQVV